MHMVMLIGRRYVLKKKKKHKNWMRSYAPVTRDREANKACMTSFFFPGGIFSCGTLWAEPKAALLTTVQHSTGPAWLSFLLLLQIQEIGSEESETWAPSNTSPSEDLKPTINTHSEVRCIRASRGLSLSLNLTRRSWWMSSAPLFAMSLSAHLPLWAITR